MGINQTGILCETSRLLLRYQLIEDEKPLLDLWTDPMVTKFLGGPRDRAVLKPLFEETTKNPRAEMYDLWVLIEKDSGAVAGHCGLLEKEVEGKREIELVYLLAFPFWGRGFATEIGLGLMRYAFDGRGLARIICLIEPGNEASEKVAVKLGMHLEKEVIRPGDEVRKVYVRTLSDHEGGKNEEAR